MQNLAVHWHEGLFLRPHHLQAWDRHWRENLVTSERCQSPFGYGVARIAINPDSLASGAFQIDGIRAKLPDGTLVDLPPAHGPRRIDVRAALADRDDDPAATLPLNGRKSVTVYLAIPRLRLGGSNVAETSANSAARYQSQQLEIPDEADAASVEPVMFRRINEKLLLSGEDLSGYEVLPIARIRRGSTGSDLAELDPDFVPPLLDCAAWPALRQGMLGRLLDKLTSKIELLSDLIAAKSESLEVSSSGDLQSILMLDKLNTAAAVLTALVRSGAWHPADVYLELVRTIGALDLMGPSRAFEPVPPYDHDSIGPLFAILIERIETRIALAGRSPYRQRFFTGITHGMQLPLDPAWLSERTKLVLGIRRGPLSERDLDDLLRAGKLDWKFGARDEVETLYARRLPGIRLSLISGDTRHLPSRSQWSFFALDSSAAAWKNVTESGTLAFRLNADAIDSDQPLQGEKTLHLRFGDHGLPLQFAVFAIASGDGT